MHVGLRVVGLRGGGRGIWTHLPGSWGRALGRPTFSPGVPRYAPGCCGGSQVRPLVSFAPSWAEALGGGWRRLLGSHKFSHGEPAPVSAVPQEPVLAGLLMLSLVGGPHLPTPSRTLSQRPSQVWASQELRRCRTSAWPLLQPRALLGGPSMYLSLL